MRGVSGVYEEGVRAVRGVYEMPIRGCYLRRVNSVPPRCRALDLSLGDEYSWHLVELVLEREAHRQARPTAEPGTRAWQISLGTSTGCRSHPATRLSGALAAPPNQDTRFIRRRDAVIPFSKWKLRFDVASRVCAGLTQRP